MPKWFGCYLLRRACRHDELPKLQHSLRDILVPQMLADRNFVSVGESGFTLVETVAVIVIAAALAALVISRIDQNRFSSRSFADRVRESLQYAQKTAIAQRRNVCVAISSNTLTLTRAASNGDVMGCTVTIADASGNSSFVLSAPSGITLSGLTALVFGAQGQPLKQPLNNGEVLTTDTSLTVNGSYSATITIEKITGLIH